MDSVSFGSPYIYIYIYIHCNGSDALQSGNVHTKVTSLL